MEGLTARTDKLPCPSFLLIMATLHLTSGALLSRGSNTSAPATAIFCSDPGHGRAGGCLIGEDGMELEYLIDSPHFPSRMLAGDTCPAHRTVTTNTKEQPAACGRNYERGKPYTPCVPPPNCKRPCDVRYRAPCS